MLTLETVDTQKVPVFIHKYYLEYQNFVKLVTIPLLNSESLTMVLNDKLSYHWTTCTISK